MKITLQEWLSENGLSLEANDAQFVADILDCDGTVVDCDDSAVGWGFWLGESVMVETSPCGTRVVHEGRYSVTTKLGYYDLRQCGNGMTPEETSLYVDGLDWPVYAVAS